MTKQYVIAETQWPGLYDQTAWAYPSLDHARAVAAWSEDERRYADRRPWDDIADPGPCPFPGSKISLGVTQDGQDSTMGGWCFVETRGTCDIYEVPARRQQEHAND